jgi:CBS domain containing-hemolysin-like protein
MDILNPLFFIGLAFFLIALNGFFVNAEFSIVKVRETRLQELMQQGNRRAATALRIVGNMDEYLSATQLGITLSSLGLGWVGEPAFRVIFEPILSRFGLDAQPALRHTLAAGMAFILITILHIVLGELAPKSLAMQKPEKSVLWTGPPLVWFYRLSYPFNCVLNGAATLFLRAVGIKSNEEVELEHSEEELHILLSKSGEGVLNREKKRLLMKVFSFSQRSVRQVMVPSLEVNYLDVQKSTKENLSVVFRQKHTRYPLCKGGLDHILGLIHVKDLFWNYRELGPGFEWNTVKRPTLFVPESKRVDALLAEFQETRVHMAVVVDEFGTTIGIVTLEDVLEELVGEIQDEFDLESPPVMIRRSGVDRYLVNGRALIEVIEEKLNIKLEDEENDTIAGHVMMMLGRTARIGDELVIAGQYNVRVVGIKGHQITGLIFSEVSE